MGRARAPAFKRLLIRELAWRVQERVHGGLDAQTLRLLNAAMRAAMRTATREHDQHPQSPERRTLEPGSSAASRQHAPRKPASARSPRTARVVTTLAPGVRLVRTWRGHRHEVLVVSDKSFRYLDRSYTNLSAIARVITGTHWSGPRFFGVISRRESSP